MWVPISNIKCKTPQVSEEETNKRFLDMVKARSEVKAEEKGILDIVRDGDNDENTHTFDDSEGLIVSTHWRGGLPGNGINHNHKSCIKCKSSCL